MRFTLWSYAEQERYMLANKLFREGLDRIFASGKLEITAADRKYYEDMAERAKGIPEEKVKPLEEYKAKVLSKFMMKAGKTA